MTATRRENARSQTPAPAEPKAEGSLASSLYHELHHLAARKMRFERANHTLQPTALVHEAWLKLADSAAPVWPDRGHFLAAAAQTMRHILVDHARARGSGKRGAGAVQVTLDENLVLSPRQDTDVLMVDEALRRLADLDPRQAKILEMHFFAGMTFDEIAVALDISTRTVKRDWTMARAWFHHELSTKR